MASLEFFEAVSAGGEGSRLVVRRTHERNGWASLPPALCSRLLDERLPLPLAIEFRPVQQRGGMSLPSETAFYAAWEGASTGMPGCVGLPARLAQAMGLEDGAAVAVRPLPHAPAAVSVTVEPVSFEDWQIVEINAGYLEDTLLSQVGVASPHQPLPVWIRSVGVMLRVTALEPAAPVVRLVRGTEIYVAPRPRVEPGTAVGPGGELLPVATAQQQQQAQQQHNSNGTNGRQARAGASKGLDQDGVDDEDESAAPLQAVLRVQQLDDGAAGSALATSLQQQQEQRPQHGQQGAAPAQQLPPGVQQVFALPATLARCGLQPGDWVRLSGRATRSLVKFARLAASELVAPGHLALTQQQCEWAGAPPFSYVRLQRLSPGQRQLILDAAQARGASGHAADAHGATVCQPADAGRSDIDDDSAVQQERQQRHAGLGRGEEKQQQGGTAGSAAALATASWLRRGAEEALRHLLPILGFTPRSLLQSWGVPRPGGLLVTGPPGSGKSAMLAATAAALQRHPDCLTYTVTISCRDITAEGASQAQAQILPKVHEALDHLPSLLVLDDLDVLCPAEAAGADGAASSADPALVAWLCELLDHLATPSPDWGRLPPRGSALSSSSTDASSPPQGAAGVAAAAAGRSSSLPGTALGAALWPPLAVAATCRNAASLAAPLRAAGRLDHVVSLPAPTAESRAAILGAAASARGAQLAPQHLRFVAEAADGFDAADLEVLLDRAMHVAVRRQLASGAGAGPQLAVAAETAAAVAASDGGSTVGGSSSGGCMQRDSQHSGGSTLAPAAPGPLQLTRADMEEALRGFTPAAFWGTGTRQAVQAGVEGWGDVGGMEEAAEALHEALELPTKYARLVAKAPLRLRTGVLLYGPPGCGKTHVVAAAVAAAKVRCITVSGPELLNKYIGASEAAVRDVFARAAAAAPSVLFFDEFDAIAPQRGHDNTGVTDRVVNQLLTELDGVEGLRGVCVVAATSRPDLIDAALLRPGRLDRLVFCGFPSPLERGQVLRALARGVQLGPDVDLYQVGYNAEFFSGADLSALLAEAQLAAVHEALEAQEAEAAAAPDTAADTCAAAGKPARPHTHPRPNAHARAQPPVIEARHLAAALRSVRPSVPEAERERLEAIYAGFRQDREPGAAAQDKGKAKLVSWA